MTSPQSVPIRVKRSWARLFRNQPLWLVFCTANLIIKSVTNQSFSNQLHKWDVCTIYSTRTCRVHSNVDVQVWLMAHSLSSTQDTNLSVCMFLLVNWLILYHWYVFVETWIRWSSLFPLLPPAYIWTRYLLVAVALCTLIVSSIILKFGLPHT